MWLDPGVSVPLLEAVSVGGRRRPLIQIRGRLPPPKEIFSAGSGPCCFGFPPADLCLAFHASSLWEAILPREIVYVAAGDRCGGSVLS